MCAHVLTNAARVRAPSTGAHNVSRLAYAPRRTAAHHQQFLMLTPDDTISPGGACVVFMLDVVCRISEHAARGPLEH